VVTEGVDMAVDRCDKKFSFQPLVGKKFVSLSGKDLQESLMKWYFKHYLYTFRYSFSPECVPARGGNGGPEEFFHSA